VISSRKKPNNYQVLVAACVAALVLVGCTTVGPPAVRSGRLAYNAAINETNNQQMLMVIVRNRYQESGSLLAVSSIAANVRITTRAGVELGFGDETNYGGNLVPFSAGVIYEDNPTISYTPVAGARYARQLFAPVSITLLAKLTGSLADPGYVYRALVSGVNDIRNPDFQFPPDSSDPRFDRFVKIVAKLTQAQRLYWIESGPEADNLAIVIDHHHPEYTPEVLELLDLLGLPAPSDPSARVILPVAHALDERESGGLGITTRSVGNLVEILSAAVEVPEADMQKGIAMNYPPLGLAGKNLRVRRSEKKPKDASVAVEYRDGWFYIDETDQATKRFFRLLGALWSVSIADSAAGSPAPVLTVPVSR
jgi:hypothetical protein